MTERCAAHARSRGDQLFGTASRARRWLLVEQPGPWGSDALVSSGLPTQVASHLRSLARSLPARVLLIRRTGGVADPHGRRTVLVASSRPDGSWLQRLQLDRIEDLLEVPLHGLADGDGVGGERLDDPYYLVCTNGRHDACCAEYGLPVARALSDTLGDRVWECSHVGGDRFAGNVVCLPDGVFYGSLDPATARAAVTAHEAGRVLLERFRGRSAVPFVVQAAESFVRQGLHLDQLTHVRFASSEREGQHDDVHRVRFHLEGGNEATAVVRTARTEPRMLTCGGRPTRAPVYELLELRTTRARQ